LSSENFQIVEVQPDDLLQLITFSRKTFYAAFGSQNTAENMRQYDAHHFSTGQMQSELQNPDSGFYFAKLDGEILGYIKINQGAAQTVHPNEGGMEIERIYVDQHLKGKGIGKSLLQQAVILAERAGLKYIWLGVWEHNLPAIRFYERNGFRRYGQHIFYLGNDPQTDLLMKFAL
jgi:diamine N-acetyltransferase